MPAAAAVADPGVIWYWTCSTEDSATTEIPFEGLWGQGSAPKTFSCSRILCGTRIAYVLVAPWALGCRKRHVMPIRGHFVLVQLLCKVPGNARI